MSSCSPWANYGTSLSAQMMGCAGRPEIEPIVRGLVALIMLVFAAALDVRTRRVGNMLWLPYVPAGVALTIWAPPIAVDAVGAVLLVFLAFMAWLVRQIGGADVKGIAMLALIDPANAGIAVLVSAAVAIVASLRRRAEQRHPFMVFLLAGYVVALALDLTGLGP